MHCMDAEKFIAFKDSMSGLTAKNIPVMEQRLIELGLSAGPPVIEVYMEA